MVLKAHALVDLTTTKRYIKVPTAISADDDLIEDLINSCSKLAESYCNRRFRGSEITEYYDGSNTAEILLKQWPVNSITEIREDLSRVFPVSSILDASNYSIITDENQEGISVRRFDRYFSKGRSSVKITYSFGYATFDDVPDDLALAVKRTIGYYWKQQQNSDFNETAKSKGDENITLIEGIPKSASLILDNYVRLEIQAPPNPTK